ncbi:MAG: SPASM domain-containing protein [Elusimicrobia bacterium]|nr:SPASM domain-containing protein [Elusimicrobiota bacterium]
MYFESTLAEKARKFFRLVLGSYAFPPRDITVEVTTRCSRGCAVCFRGPLGVRPEDMPRELFTKTLSEIRAAYAGRGPRYLNFVGLGEPFCRPDLPKLLREAAAALPGTELNLSTGLVPFDAAAFEGLVRDKTINRLSVSLDGVEKGGAFHGFTPEVSAAFLELKGIKERNPGFKIRIQTLLTSWPAVEAAVRYAAELGAEEIQLMRVDLHAFGDAPPAARPAFAEERAMVAAAKKLAAKLGLACRNNNVYDLFMDIAGRGGRRCLISDDHVFITAAGDLIPCFYLREVKFGNLSRQTLAQACAGRKEKDLYGRQTTLCRGCDIYRKEHAA